MSLGSIPSSSRNHSILALMEDAISEIKVVAEEVSTSVANTETKVLGVFDPMRFGSAHAATLVDPADQAAGENAVDSIAALVKSKLSGAMAADITSLMTAHFKQMRFIDDSGQWTLPELASFGLIPTDADSDTLERFVAAIAAGVKQNPNLLSFLAKAKATGTSALRAKVDAEGREVLTSVITYAMVQDRLLKAMRSHPSLLEKCLDQWEAAAAQEPQFNEVMDAFEKIKLPSVKIAARLSIDQIKASAVDPRFGRALLPGNIGEAIAVDEMAGRTANVHAGVALMETYNSLTADGCSTLSEDGKSIRLGLPLAKEWDDLYTSWNLAFIGGEYKNWPFVMAKLLNPEVMDYQQDPQAWMTSQRMPLLLTQLYFAMFGRVDRALSSKLDWALPPDLVRAWGDANAQSAAIYKNDVKLSR